MSLFHILMDDGDMLNIFNSFLTEFNPTKEISKLGNIKKSEIIY